MNYQDEEIISAAIDGERVDVTALRRALASNEGQELLASFVLLRAEVVADDLEARELAPVGESRRPSSEREPASWQPRVPRESRARRWFQAGSRVPIRLAASLAALAVAGSFWLGTSWTDHATTPSGGQNVSSGLTPASGQPVGQPATGAPNVATTPGAPPPQSVGAGRTTQSPFDAGEPPRPTRQLRLDLSTSWKAGG
jgi:hypothetical protein